MRKKNKRGSERETQCNTTTKSSYGWIYQPTKDHHRFCATRSRLTLDISEPSSAPDDVIIYPSAGLQNSFTFGTCRNLCNAKNLPIDRVRNWAILPSRSHAAAVSGATKKRLRRRATIYIVKSLPGPSPTSLRTQLHFVVLAFFSIKRFCFKADRTVSVNCNKNDDDGRSAPPTHYIFCALQHQELYF